MIMAHHTSMSKQNPTVVIPCLSITKYSIFQSGYFVPENRRAIRRGSFQALVHQLRSQFAWQSNVIPKITLGVRPPYGVFHSCNCYRPSFFMIAGSTRPYGAWINFLWLVVRMYPLLFLSVNRYLLHIPELLCVFQS